MSLADPLLQGEYSRRCGVKILALLAVAIFGCAVLCDWSSEDGQGLSTSINTAVVPFRQRAATSLQQAKPWPLFRPVGPIPHHFELGSYDRISEVRQRAPVVHATRKVLQVRAEYSPEQLAFLKRKEEDKKERLAKSGGGGGAAPSPPPYSAPSPPPAAPISSWDSPAPAPAAPAGGGGWDSPAPAPPAPAPPPAARAPPPTPAPAPAAPAGGGRSGSGDYYSVLGNPAPSPSSQVLQTYTQKAGEPPPPLQRAAAEMPPGKVSRSDLPTTADKNYYSVLGNPAPSPSAQVLETYTQKAGEPPPPLQRAAAEMPPGYKSRSDLPPPPTKAPPRASAAPAAPVVGDMSGGKAKRLPRPTSSLELLQPSIGGNQIPLIHGNDIMVRDWDDQVKLAKIIAIEQKEIFIRFDGRGAESDEWIGVASSRLQGVPPAGR